jgi:uncharacterized protein DUF3828
MKAKMKRMRISPKLTVVALILAACAATPTVQREPPPSSGPDEVVRQFYSWYLSERFPDARKGNAPQFRKYVTQRFLKDATDPDVEAVLFIDAQDADPSWAKHFSVSKATIRGDKATAEVTLLGEKVHYKLHVTLRREHGAWKIDNAKGSNWKSV